MNGNLLLLGIEGPELSDTERKRFERLQPAGYILFSRNIVSPEQTRELTDSLRSLHTLDPIIAIDQEGGRVTRTKEIAPVVPSANDLAAQGNPVNIANAGAYTADLLRLLGFNLNFAPVLDLDHHVGASNALRGRCWGRDPQRVIDHAGMWNRWMRKRSLRSCAKHFPACGRAKVDPHHDLPSSNATIKDLLAEDIIPYTALMPELDAIMVGHVSFPAIDPELPASLSPKIINGFLRGQLGFDRHLVLTDDLDMGAIADRFPDNSDVPAAIHAGNDLAMICHRMERADEAAHLISELPGNVAADAEKRVEKFRKKLHAPLVWDEDKWSKTCEKIAELAAEVPATGDEAVANSPVADY
ncbi:beta-N-acetylhexosaminidase [Haloferula helveola]|uniref:Beta-N-acetylhexosaminidase n=1 Tax=Haloferula helveola TaxID=490095 RepID=A0ABN6HFZ9_9BACT|nr:beta-N-acetylhexosaminidase [Haloferula helveola]